MEKLDVIFEPPKPIDGLVYCSWSRGTSPETMQEIGIRFLPPIYGSTQGPQYTGREDIYPNCSLSISNLTFQDAVNYLLIEGGPGLFIVGYASPTVVDFLLKPNVTAKPSNSILELAPVRLHCNAPKDLTITWFKDGELYTKGSHLMDNNETLFIPSVSKSDAGGYQCQITNHTSTRISDILKLNVVYGPDPPVINETIDVSRGLIKLTCKAVVFPPALYTWFYNGMEWSDDKILFQTIISENSGNYTCRVINPISFLTRNTTLAIDMKRKF